MIKHFLIFILLIFTFHSTIFAISDSTKNTQSRILKINWTQILTFEVDISLDYFIKTNKSVETTFGIVFPCNGTWFGRSAFWTNGEMNRAGLYHHKGIMLSTQYKLYNEKGMYISPLLKYRYLYFDNLRIKTNTGEGAYTYYYLLEDSRRQTYTVEILFGIENSNKIKFDFYTGIGIRYIYSNIEVKEIYGSGPIRDPGYFNNSYFTPTFHLGIKLGFDFKKK